jgi:hypothetical protein
MKTLLFLCALLETTALHAATYDATPDTWKSVYSQAQKAGDVVILADGTYPRTEFFTSEITYKAENMSGAIFNGGIYLDGRSSDLTFDGIWADNSPGQGIEIRGNGHMFKNVKVTDSGANGVLFRCAVNPPEGALCPPESRPSNVTLQSVDVSLSTSSGIKSDCGEANIIKNSRSHHNHSSGYLESPTSVHTVIESNEFDHNGVNDHDHGAYLKGQSSHFYHNLLHHNAGYGIHCWAACFGTKEEPYDIRFNTIYANESGGTVIAGTWKEAVPPGDGYPRFVFYWHNTETGNGLRGGG